MATNKGRKGRGATAGSWKPGQSGNPKGRPKKDRALTQILAKAAEKTFEYINEDGQTVRRKRSDFIAEMVMMAVTTGKVHFPALEEGDEPTTLILDNTDWMNLLKFYYARVEGNPTSKVEKKSESVVANINVDKETLEKIAQQRWAENMTQILELVEDGETSTKDLADDGHTNETIESKFIDTQ